LRQATCGRQGDTETLTASVAGAEFSLSALEFCLASRIADYVASVAGTRRPAVGKCSRACFRPMTCRSLRASAHRPFGAELGRPGNPFKDWPIAARSSVWDTADDFALAPDRLSDG